MAKLTRFTLPVFAGSATQMQTSVFGTMKTSPEYTTDVAAAINTQAYSDGWFEAIELGYAPFVEDMNSLQRAITYQISYGQQQGIPEWASDTEYYIGSFAKLNTATGAQVYCSLVDNNVGNLVSDTTKWKLVLDTANTCVTVNTAQTITAEKTFSVSPQVPTPTAGDSSTKAANTEFVTGVETSLQTQINTKATPTDISNAVSNLLATLYPVGAIYIGTQNSCPLATLISGSTWTKIGTSITTDVTIPSSIAVYGNGKTLGLTLNNSSNYGLSFGTNNSWGLRLNTGFGSNINSSVSETSTTVNKALGITNKTNGDSGIVAKSDSITKTSITVNIWKRTA